jgi:cytosine deaminase
MSHEQQQTATQKPANSPRPAFAAAYQAAQKSLSEGGIPIGAALARDGVVTSGHNERVQNGDPIAHGDMSALRAAGRQESYRDTTLYSTLAPCAMCTGTMIQFKIPRVVVGEARTFDGEFELLRSRGVEVVVLDDQRCVDMMRTFQNNNPDRTFGRRTSPSRPSLPCRSPGRGLPERPAGRAGTRGRPQQVTRWRCLE